jgi:hypothetical protein
MWGLAAAVILPMIAQGVGHLRGDRCFFFDNACRQYPRYAALPLSPFLDPKHPVIGEHPLHRSSRALFPAHGLGQMAMNLAGDPLHRGAFLPQVVESSVPQPKPFHGAKPIISNLHSCSSPWPIVGLGRR